MDSGFQSSSVGNMKCLKNKQIRVVRSSCYELRYDYEKQRRPLTDLSRNGGEIGNGNMRRGKQRFGDNDKLRGSGSGNYITCTSLLSLKPGTRASVIVSQWWRKLIKTWDWDWDWVRDRDRERKSGMMRWGRLLRLRGEKMKQRNQAREWDNTNARLTFVLPTIERP
jgi:hypothetical protein